MVKTNNSDSVRPTMKRGLIVLALLLATTASAHHILGIPHYNYDERYPQVPVLERVVNREIPGFRQIPRGYVYRIQHCFNLLQFF